MVVMAISAGSSRLETLAAGSETTNRITFGGTMNPILGVGLSIGLSLGILFVALRPWLSGLGQWRGLVFGVLIFGGLGYALIDPTNPDFTEVGHLFPNVIVVAILFVVFGVVLAPLVEWTDHALPGSIARQHRWPVMFVGYATMIIFVFLGVLSVLSTILSLPYTLLDRDFYESAPFLVVYLLIVPPLLYRRRVRAMLVESTEPGPRSARRLEMVTPSEMLFLTLPFIVGIGLTTHAILTIASRAV